MHPRRPTLMRAGRHALVLVAVGAGVSAFAGCSSADEDSAEGTRGAAEVAEQFVASLGSGEAKRPCSFLDPPAQRALIAAMEAPACPDAIEKLRSAGGAGGTPSLTDADVVSPAPGLATSPTKDAIVDGVKLTGESAAVAVPDLDVPGLVSSGRLLLINTSAGWTITAPAA